jgi:hypothetical protein
MTPTDKVALERALVACRAQSAARAKQIDDKLRDEPWSEVAEFAAGFIQSKNLGLMPWQLAPSTINLETALREPYGEADGRREGAELLKKMLAFGLSKFEADPVAALARAEAEQPKN